MKKLNLLLATNRRSQQMFAICSAAKTLFYCSGRGSPEGFDPAL